LKIVIYLSILIALVGCNSGNKNISLLIYNENDPFIQDMTHYIKEETTGSYNLTVLNSENFQIIQNENIEDRISAGDDLLIINPVDRLGVYPIIKKLKSKNIPVIFFNRAPLEKDLELWDKAYYVGTKGLQSAQIQAEMVEELFGSDPNSLNKYDKNGNGIIETVILKGEQGHQDAEVRTTEVVKSLKRSGFKLDILITEVADWDRFEAYDKMKIISNDYKGQIELVISNNDSMAIGAIAAMRQNGIFRDDNENGRIDKNDDNWIPVIGIDGISEAVELINTGYLYGTVLNDAKMQAEAIKELADAILNNREFESSKFKLIDKRLILIDYKILQ